MKKRFAYKIWSNYNGFTPDQLPERLRQNRMLELGWPVYLDDVELGDEVWVYFHGRHSFTNGVYFRGTVKEINRRSKKVLVRKHSASIDEPLVTGAPGEHIANVVPTSRRQVFLLPDEFLLATEECTITTTGTTCKMMACGTCPIFGHLPHIRAGGFRVPERLRRFERRSSFVPGIWIAPSRCFLGRGASEELRRASRVFYDFKTGNLAKAYPFALSVSRALKSEKLDRPDVVIPIPLSPDKKEAGEVDRVEALAKAISRHLGAPLRKYLRLAGPISKRRPPWGQLGPAGYEMKYRTKLHVSPQVARYRRLLVVDDVATRGATLAAVTEELLATNPAAEIVVATGGLMVTKSVVTDRAESALRRGR